MTITVNDARNEYTATASQTVFSYTFRIFSATDLNVYVTPSGQDANDLNDITTSYTVSGVDDEAGGAITLSSGVNAGDLVTIVSNIPSSRTTDYQANGDFVPDTVNGDIDRVVALTKQVEDVSNRSLVAQQAQQGQKPLTLPSPIASSLMRWKGDLTGFENVSLAELDSDLILDQDLIKVFDTVASMVADTGLAVGKKVRTLGYYSTGDGGGNDYEIVAAATGADDGGSFIDLMTYQAKGLFVSAIINVKQFGAKGDGVTDDTTSIANAVKQGGAFAPDGVYIIDTITASNNFSLRGGSYNTVLKHKGSCTGFMFVTNLESIKVELSNFIFDGNKANQIIDNSNAAMIISQSDGASLTDEVFIDIHHVKFQNTSYGAIYFYGSLDNTKQERLSVKHCIFIDGSESTATFNPRFIGVLDGAISEIKDNFFDWGATPATSPHPAIWIAATSAVSEVNGKHVITGNKIRRCGRDVTGSGIGALDIYIWGENCIVEGNVFEECYVIPIRIKTNSRNTVISNNIIRKVFSSGSNKYSGISMVPMTTGATENTLIITGNIVEDVDGGSGIEMDSSPGAEFDYINISNNIVKNVGLSGVRVDETLNIVVGGNIINTCGEYGVRMDGADHVTVDHNILKNTTLAGVRFSGIAETVKIRGNVMDTVVTGIQNGGASTTANVEVSGNHIKDAGAFAVLCENVLNLLAVGNTNDNVATGFRAGGTPAVAFARISGNSHIGVTTDVQTTGLGFTKIFQTENSWN